MVRKKMLLLALMSVIALVLFPATVGATDGDTPPERPWNPYGTVTIDGQAAASGTTVTAVIDGNETTVTLPCSPYSAGWYSIMITQPSGQNYTGKAVSFLVNGQPVDASGTWELGMQPRINLVLGEAAEGGTCKCKIMDVVIGNVTGYNSTTGVITLAQSDLPKGDKGDTGTTGPKGDQGEAGKAGSNIFGIVGIVVAVIALIVAAVVMLRKKPA